VTAALRDVVAVMYHSAGTRTCRRERNMRKTTAVAAVTVMTLAALAMAGCSSWFESPAKPANDAIAVANAHLKVAAALETSVSAGGSALQSLPYTPTGSTDAVKITGAAMEDLTKERAELLSAKTAIDGIEKLDVSQQFKSYAKLESASIDARVALVDAESRLYDAMDRLYKTLADKSTKVDVQEMITAIQQMQSEVAALSDTAGQASQAASDFFNANKLGG
jgi:hypothetical protein